MAGSNDTFAGVFLHVFAAGQRAPFEQTWVTGGGVFALGDFSLVVNADGPDGRTGTFVFLRDDGVTSVPVVFAT